MFINKGIVKTYIDYETRSTSDLKKQGTYLYAKHKTTDALCLAYSFDDGPNFLWALGQDFPKRLANVLLDDKNINVAHNAAFEFLIWNLTCVKKYQWPKIPLSRFDCTMVRASAMGLPAKLEFVANAVGLHHKKDMEGHRIMMQLCKPRSYDKETGKPIWWTDKEKYRKLYKYCVRDIDVLKRIR